MALTSMSDWRADATVWPLVTAVVPTMNRPQLLIRAVQSVIDQDYPGDIECLIVYDGTEPVMPEVALRDGRTVRVLVNNRTPGLAGNRNTGYVAATGELVGSCDDDDEWLPGKLRAQVDLLRKHPEASAAASGFVYHYRGKDIPRLASLPALTFADLLNDRHIEANASTYLIPRAELLSVIGLVDEQLPGSYAEDYELLLRAARQGPIVCVEQAQSRVYLHDSSFFASRWQTINDALTYLLERVPEFAQDPAGLARIEGQIAFSHAALGNRASAAKWALRSLRKSRRARQSYAALVVASRLASADRVLATARRFGRGI
ncbi:MAG TPA: glycosyltransferase family 2 protein [Jatrophihabitans sp.]|jgi:glycosyltransferase involved in cell wall biosynthesis|uniref:glycosyltransferase family 2 protein n=1 Tax=Jatrophihabitans sp. TaxID=1932789 RepID=UPI002EE3E7D7